MIDSAPYGTTQAGNPVHQYTMTGDSGLIVRFISLGGIITTIEAPDRDGRSRNVVLGLPGLAGYETIGGSFGALIGRYANRIAKGRFTLHGRTYQLAINDPPNSLHGGTARFSRMVWDVVPASGDGTAAKLTLKSPDDPNGYPGTMHVEVTYRVTGDNALRIDYSAKTDKPTVVNLTNHSYFNLAGNGSGSVENQLLLLNADAYTPVDATLIPTGEIAPVSGTPLDFRHLAPIGARLRSDCEQLLRVRGYDHNFVLNHWRSGEVRFAARAYDPACGRVLDCYTDQPGVQLYTANHLDGSVVGSAATAYRQTDGFALETQHFPDSPNHANFPSTVLNPGERFRSTTIFRFATDRPFPALG
jgi:aldose 1-epimerase